MRALVLDKESSRIRATVQRIDAHELPPSGDLLVRVMYSSLNYKDALAVTGTGRIIRGSYPFVAGIDLVAEVLESNTPLFSKGEKVIGTGGGLGETTWGGYAEIQRIPSDSVVRLPPTLSPYEAMMVGTAGFTGMLALMAIETSQMPDSNLPIVVTGASGGVGSFAVYFFSSAGYTVVAATGSESDAYLRRLGATRVIARSILSAGAEKPLDSARWAGAVDTVGAETLQALISQTARRGTIAACGMVGGASIQTSVYPFILRGVKLFGIDSNTSPLKEREEAWNRIAGLMQNNPFPGHVSTIALEEVEEYARRLLRGEVQGRLVVEPSAIA